MSLDEAPKHVELLVQLDDHVVLLEVLGRRLSRSCLVLSCLELPLPLPGCYDSFSNRDVLGVVEREASEVLDGLGLGGGEEEGLARFGEVGDDGVDRGGESHIETAIGFIEDCNIRRLAMHRRLKKGRTKDLELIALEAERLVHVLEKSSRRSDENVHPRKPVLLVLQALASNNETRRELMAVANLAQDLEDLNRLEHKSISSVILSIPAALERTSSLVGLITSAPSPSVGPHFFLSKISSTGTKNASVFPLPVRAAPSTSFPLSARGRARAWMSVSLEK